MSPRFASSIYAIAMAAISSQASSQELSLDANIAIANLHGEISSSAAAALVDFLDNNPSVRIISLDSPGGVVVAALDAAQELNRRRISTFIPGHATCASACSILFFSGHDRLAIGNLGIHQMDDGGRSSASIIQFLVAAQIDAYERYGIPMAITKRMLTTPPSEMYWVSEQEKVDFQINRDLPEDLGDLMSGSPAAEEIRVSVEKPGFTDYPATTFLANGPGYPDFSGRDRDYRNYRTRITDGARKGVNFAGHYSIIEVGCGTSCRFAFVVDLRTGQVGSFPYGGEEQYQMTLLYSKDSRLLRAKWLGDWNNESCTEVDLVLEGLNWSEIDRRQVPPLQGYCDFGE